MSDLEFTGEIGYLQRIAYSNNRTTRDKIYVAKKMRNMYGDKWQVTDDNGDCMTPTISSKTTWKWVLEDDYRRQVGEEELRKVQEELAKQNSLYLPPCYKSSLPPCYKFDDNSTTEFPKAGDLEIVAGGVSRLEVNSVEESTMVKIEEVTLVDGVRSDELSDHGIICKIRKEKQSIADLEELGVESKNIKTQINIHRENIEKLVAILDKDLL
jgi:hypothetical protein